MKALVNPYVVAAKIVQPLIDFGRSVDTSGLAPALAELVKIRASQISGCSMRLHMHTQDPRKAARKREAIA